MIKPFILSFKLALISTIILLIISLPLAYYLSKKKKTFIIESIASLPIVLPPSVLGFYLLILFSPYSFFGGFLLKNFNIKLAFSFNGLILASIIYSFPFMFLPILNAFKQIPKNLILASYSLKKSELYTFLKVILPLSKNHILSASIMAFSHIIGEFGIILMIGGAKEDTKVISIAIYEAVEDLNFKLAHTYSIILLIFCFLILLILNYINSRSK